MNNKIKTFKIQIIVIWVLLILFLLLFSFFVFKFNKYFFINKDLLENYKISSINLGKKYYLTQKFPEFYNFDILRQIYSGNFSLYGNLKQPIYLKNFAEANSIVFQILKNLDNSGFLDRLTFKQGKQIFLSGLKALDLYSGLSLYLSGKEGKLKNMIDYNYIKTKSLLDLFGVYLCSLRYKETFKEFDKLESKVEKVKDLLNQNISLIKNLLPGIKDPYLKDCFRKLLQSFQKSLVNLIVINQELKSYLFNFKKSFYSYITSYDKCISDDNFFEGIKDGLKLMEKGLDNYIDQYGKLYKILKYGGEFYRRQLCMGSSKLSNKFSKNNQKLSEGFKKLTDRLKNKNFSYNKKNNNGGSPKEKKKNKENFEKQKKESGNKKNLKEREKNGKEKNQNSGKTENKSGGNGEKRHYHINEYEVKNLMNKIWKRGESRINRMQSIKSSPNYNPENILRQWFKEFYGNDSEFRIFKDLNGE